MIEIFLAETFRRELFVALHKIQWRIYGGSWSRAFTSQTRRAIVQLEQKGPPVSRNAAAPRRPPGGVNARWLLDTKIAHQCLICDRIVAVPEFPARHKFSDQQTAQRYR